MIQHLFASTTNPTSTSNPTSTRDRSHYRKHTRTGKTINKSIATHRLQSQTSCTESISDNSSTQSRTCTVPAASGNTSAASRSKQQGQTPTGRGGITRRRIASSRCSNCSTCRQKIMSLASSPDQTQHSPNATRPTLTHSLAHQPAPRAIITFGTKGYIIGIRDTRVVSTKYSGQIRGLSWFGRIRGDHALYISIDM